MIFQRNNNKKKKKHLRCRMKSRSRSKLRFIIQCKKCTCVEKKIKLQIDLDFSIALYFTGKRKVYIYIYIYICRIFRSISRNVVNIRGTRAPSCALFVTDSMKGSEPIKTGFVTRLLGLRLVFDFIYARHRGICDRLVYAK